MAGTFRLVVARQKTEDIAWVNRVSKQWHRTIITKDVDLPNTGREVSSFLLGMERAYEDDGWIAFVQANPQAHYGQIRIALELKQLPQQFLWLGDGMAESDEVGRPWHAWELPVKEYYEDLIGPWKGNVQFAPGGQFIIPAWILRGRTKKELIELRERVCVDPDGPWVLERLWQEYFVS